MGLLELKLLVLIVGANAAPILANHVARWLPATPVDLGFNFIDKKPLFGTSKTWRGLACALLFGALLGGLLKFPVTLSLGVVSLAMLGDLISSFLKRRLDLPASDRALLLDQIPESLLPALWAQQLLGLPLASIVWIVFLFIILELAVSPVAYRFRIRKKPY